MTHPQPAALRRIRGELLRAIDERKATPRYRRGPVTVATLMLLAAAIAAAIALRVTLNDDDRASGEVDVTPVESARTSADGRVLVLSFVGANPALPPDNPCSAAYDGVVHETDATVLVGVEVRHPDWEGGEFGCTAEGHARNVTVGLATPLAGREVRDLERGTTILVVDGARVRTPTSLPAGYRMLAEYEEPGPVQAWVQVFVQAGEEGGDSRPTLTVKSGDRTLWESYGGWVEQPSVDIGGVVVDTRQDPRDPAHHVALVDAADAVVVAAEYLGPHDEALSPQQLAEIAVSAGPP